MALLNPVYGLIVPFLFIVTVPLAILAGITTTLAFSLLIFRAGLVYIDIVVNMVPQYVAGRPVYPLFGNRGSYLNTGAGGGATTTTTVSSIPATTSSSTTTPSLQQASPVSMSSSTGGLGHHAPGGSSPTASRQQQVVVARNNHRRRRASAASFISMGGGSSTPTDETSNNNSNNNINNDNGIGGVGGGGSSSSKRSSFMMPSSVGMDRDFEGVGGWRLNGKPANEGDGDDDDDDDDDDDAWTHINSRLSLPLMDPLWRHHHRSPSGAGTVTPGGGGGGGGNVGGGEYLMMMRSPSSGLASEERLYEHGSGSKRGRERRGEKDGAVPRTGGVSPNRSRVRTPTRMLPPLTSVDGTDGSYFPRVVSPRAEKRSI
ncbi:hypothetical protein SLS53_004221 [Cytospora paraplurivora]|uniref:Uncharacterized protein n=1 Tax=Cytospora paraplurivora TaxID=2898453 RepID=A0AAN9YGH2_9PEZI